MYRAFVITCLLSLFSCTAVKVRSGDTEIIVKPDKPFCDIKKVDPNCKTDNQKNIVNN